MARGAYKESPAVKTLHALIDFAVGEDDNPLALARRAKMASVEAAAVARFRALTPEQVRTLREALRAFLRRLVEAPSAISVARLSVDVIPVKDGRTVSVLVDGQPRDVLLYQVSTLLHQIGLERLGLCPAEDCGRPFVRIGRREYCSDRCQRRVFLSTYDPFRAQARRKDTRHGKTTRAR